MDGELNDVVDPPPHPIPVSHPASPRPSSDFHLLLRAPSGTLLLNPAPHTSADYEGDLLLPFSPVPSLSRSSK
ncbi:hypothetical protein BT69DRAFT_1277900 [Atractiella rhizophila]|nr:hypothetical protein BT69DRAFT_1277900 [Atractiella rhizophila]